MCTRTHSFSPLPPYWAEWRCAKCSTRAIAENEAGSSLLAQLPKLQYSNAKLLSNVFNVKRRHSWTSVIPHTVNMDIVKVYGSDQARWQQCRVIDTVCLFFSTRKLKYSWVMSWPTCCLVSSRCFKLMHSDMNLKTCHQLENALSALLAVCS